MRHHVGVEARAPRVCLTVSLTHPREAFTRVTVIATHLDHESAPARRRRAAEPKRWTTGFPAPYTPAGDFDASPKRAEVRVLTDGCREVRAEARARGNRRAYLDKRAERTRKRRRRSSACTDSSGSRRDRTS